MQLLDLRRSPIRPPDGDAVSLTVSSPAACLQLPALASRSAQRLRTVTASSACNLAVEGETTTSNTAKHLIVQGKKPGGTSDLPNRTTSSCDHQNPASNRTYTTISRLILSTLVRPNLLLRPKRISPTKRDVELQHHSTPHLALPLFLPLSAFIFKRKITSLFFLITSARTTTDFLGPADFILRHGPSSRPRTALKNPSISPAVGQPRQLARELSRSRQAEKGRGKGCDFTVTGLDSIT